MTAAELQEARQAYAELAWSRAHRCFAEADRAGHLRPDDLDRFSRTASLTGDDEACVDLLERAYEAHLARGDTGAAG